MSNTDTTTGSEADHEPADLLVRSHAALRAHGAATSIDGRSRLKPAPLSSQHHRSGHAREKLTIAEVCAELKVSRSTFYYWRQIGKAPRCLVLPNREVRIYRCDLDDWLDSHAEGV